MSGPGLNVERREGFKLLAVASDLEMAGEASQAKHFAVSFSSIIIFFLFAFFPPFSRFFFPYVYFLLCTSLSTLSLLFPFLFFLFSLFFFPLYLILAVFYCSVIQKQDEVKTMKRKTGRRKIACC